MKISHGIEYLLVRGLAGLFQILPYDAAVGLGSRLGRATNNVWKTRHDVIINNLKIAFGDELTEQRREELARDVFANIGMTLAEACRFAKMSRADILKRVTSEGEKVFQEALENGRGAILTGSHFGNWEMGGLYINALGYPVDFLVRGQHNKKVDDYLTVLRRKVGVGVIHSESGSGMKDVVRALKENRQVAIVSDQHAGSGGILVKFFGQLVSVPRAPATLAVKFHCPLIVGYVLRRPGNKFHCVFERAVYPDTGAERDAEILRLTQYYTGCFENIIRQYPDHWLWTHRRFKPLKGIEQIEGTLVE